MELMTRQETWNITYTHALGETASWFYAQIRDNAKIFGRRCASTGRVLGTSMIVLAPSHSGCSRRRPRTYSRTWIRLAATPALVHYLGVVKAPGPARAKESDRATVAAMKQMQTDDDCFDPGSIREDGCKIHPTYLFRVKKPEESRYAAHLATTPAHFAQSPTAAVR